MYWYVKRNVDPGRIAAALDLPIKTVHHLISRLATKKDSTAINGKKKSPYQGRRMTGGDFLDLFIFSKTRYSIVDISGSIDKQHCQKLKEEIVKISASDRRPLAFKVTDVVFVDKKGVEALQSLHADFKHQGRYCALLDPSPEIDAVFKQYGLDASIPIFGTELAFEEHAFR